MSGYKVLWIFLLVELSVAQITNIPGLTPTFVGLTSPPGPLSSPSVSTTSVYRVSEFLATSTQAASTSIASITSTSASTSASTTASTTVSTTVNTPLVVVTTLLPPASISTTTTSSISSVGVFTTSKPTRKFNVLMVNNTQNVMRISEINESQVLQIRQSMAAKLEVGIECISNKSDIQLTFAGEPIRIQKRDTGTSQSDFTLRFDVQTDKYDTSQMVKNKLVNNSFNILGNEFQHPSVYVWTDYDNCPSKPCENNSICDVAPDTNNSVSSDYQWSCLPVTFSNTSDNKGPNLLYLLLLLLIIPIVIIVVVVVYCYRKNPNKTQFVNSYNKERLQAPNYSTHPFGTLKSEKSDIIIMGGEGPPTYETNPRSHSSNTKTGTVSSVHAFENRMFEGQNGTIKSRDVEESSNNEVRPVPEGDNSMTFSYMQIRNSKVNDTTTALF